MIDSYTPTQLIILFTGLYFVAVGIGMFAERDFYARGAQMLRDDTALGLVVGLFVFALGALLISIHNDWSTPLAGLASFMGWAALIKGFFLIALRRWFVGLFSAMTLKGRALNIYASVVIVLGLLLLYFAL